MATTASEPRNVFPAVEAIPADARPPTPGEARYLLNGKVHSWSGTCHEVASPVCTSGPGGVEPVGLGRYPLMGEAEAQAALLAACDAYGHGGGEWPTMSVADRIRCVESFVPRMQAVRDEVVRLLMWEIGKTAGDAAKEFDRTVEYVADTVEALKDLDRVSSRFVLEPGFLAQVRRSPLGVVLCMGPYNYPLNETFTTLIPALIMGNTIIFKPPKYGVLLHAPLLKAFAESFPPGVVNTVYGDGATVVGPLIQSGRIDVLAFIGSSRVAALLKHQHPKPNRLRCVLGLDAKNAATVLSHADLDLAARECTLGAFSYNGQRCTAIKIVFCHRSVVDAFCEKMVAQVDRLVVGMPWEDGVKITPLPEEGKPQWLKELVDDAVGGGARIINRGGATIDHTLFHPAVLYPTRPEMRICQVEQFGPVLPVVPFDDEQEVIDWTVACPFGQQAALFGEDPTKLSRLLDILVNQVCRVNLNSQCQRGPDRYPFAGRKDSAEGTLSVSDALRVFSIRSLVAAKSTETNERIVSQILAERRSKFLSTDFIF
ncbi:MAG: NADP-dependent glyceraldehyde-3-phosphate dehydrogenase [Phycisphaerae bacterium]|jgi:glyceraldehyde-3-phosphate dehydrogenase (NADP+)